VYSGPPWHNHPRRWHSGLHRKRRFLFWRFGFFFGFIFLAILCALTSALTLLLGPGSGRLPETSTLLAIACGLPLAFALLAGLFGSIAFRRFGSPLAEVMAAADAVADGDLSVRVRENSPGELGRLARSFNRMAEELQRAEQQRRNLTADVAHELRNPLHIIQGNLEGILDGVYESSPQQIASTLEEVHLLARLVDDLQTLSLAESGQLHLHRRQISVADLLEDVGSSFANAAQEAGVELSISLQPSEGQLEIDADPDRLDQALTNLIANALRYTPSGGKIILSAQSIPDGVRLAVQDSGAGIPTEDLPFIFDRFWKGDRARSPQEGTGSGLGLAIARQLVEAHGGRIAVSSQVGSGTTFRIDLFDLPERDHSEAGEYEL
jgi:two-component system OmpR family sensor kinase/two-component system sensor histidine kinase BaeS